MQNLLAFFIKRHAFLLFVLLQVIAGILIVRNNGFHKAALFTSANSMVGGYYQKINAVSGYYGLKNRNLELATAMETMLNKQTQSMRYDTNGVVIKIDSLGKKQYAYSQALVVKSTTQFRNNYLIIDKGGNQGIAPRMGVINTRGVVGIVKNVSGNFSSVLSILNKSTTISAKIKSTGYTGRVVWDGVNYRIADLVDVPDHAKIKIGDTVLTGTSGIFPAGVPIGKITKVLKKSGESSYTIKVMLFNDYKQMTYVFVVNDLYFAEREALENEMKDE
jgi:rod shape-determining protein MreC